MPIDTAKKRRAAVPGTLPSPDGTIDAEDRAHMAGVYGLGDSTPDLGTDYAKITAMRNTVDVKITYDRGKSTSSATVPVTVTFNKTFADVKTIDVFPITNGTEKIHRIIDFVDAPDPTEFEVTLITDAGTQVARDFGWEASGIIKF